MRETAVEKALSRGVKAQGGWAVKLLPSVAGLPDRLVLFPQGRVFFVELKRPGGKPPIHQEMVHSRLRKLGFPVAVLSTPAEVIDWLTEEADSPSHA